jgi:hypothetical protein
LKIYSQEVTGASAETGVLAPIEEVSPSQLLITNAANIPAPITVIVGPNGLFVIQSVRSSKVGHLVCSGGINI